MIKTVEPIRSSPVELAQCVDTELAMNVSHTVELESGRSSAPRPKPPHIDCYIGFQLGPVMQKTLDNARWPVDTSIVEHIRRNTSECQSDPAYDDPYADIDGIPARPRQFV